jgi:hypothetical protein
MDLISQTGGLRNIAQELGVSEEQAQSGAAALLPSILGGFKKQAQSQPQGMEGLGGMLSQLGGGGLLDNVLSPEPTDIGRGNGVLGSIFGSKDVSRAVAHTAAERSGLEPSIMKRMLPMLAMLVAGQMSKQHGIGASLGGGGLGGLGGMAGSLLGGRQGGSRGGGLGAMLDMDGDGNPLDDILRMARR